MNELFSYKLEIPVNENDHSAGPANAKITLVEYGDYQCPYCGQAYPIVKQLQKDFGDDMRFVFRNFPLTQIHKYAEQAAEAAETAADFGKFWEMHDTIYENQSNITERDLVGYAANLGIDSNEFEQKLMSGAKIDKVKSDFMGGVESGVNGTPSFFINGVKYDGPWDYNDLKTVIQTVMDNS